ncbi:MAG: hypothetical protein EOO28_30820 [Comamonadaceae bacterium]|nr:MAG: hypothetical protein EOO28_30820 [Comamonadaceae bacterium]
MNAKSGVSGCFAALVFGRFQTPRKAWKTGLDGFAKSRHVELRRGLRDVLGVNDSCLTAGHLAHNKDGMTLDLVSISYRLGDGQFRALQRYE